MKKKYGDTPVIVQLHTGLNVTGANWRILLYSKINSPEILTYSDAWSGYKRYRIRSKHRLFVLVWCAVSFYDTMQFLINRKKFNSSKKIPYHMANYLLERKFPEKWEDPIIKPFVKVIRRKKIQLKLLRGNLALWLRTKSYAVFFFLLPE